jgi:hypothetical protein
VDFKWLIDSECISQQGERMWTGLNWLRIGSIIGSLANTETKLRVPYSRVFNGNLRLPHSEDLCPIQLADFKLYSSNTCAIFTSS